MVVEVVQSVELLLVTMGQVGDPGQLAHRLACVATHDRGVVRESAQWPAEDNIRGGVSVAWPAVGQGVNGRDLQLPIGCSSWSTLYRKVQRRAELEIGTPHQ